MKPALLIIDMQKEFYQGEILSQMDAAAEHINWVLPRFEEKGLPVIYVQDVDEDGGVVPGAPGFDFIDSLTPKDGAIRIHKRYGNSFNKTDVDAILKEHGVDTPVITGFCAEYCVLSTYRGAKDLDISPSSSRTASPALRKRTRSSSRTSAKRSPPGCFSNY